MVIGVPKEIKNNENRVSMTPSGVFELKKSGHQIFVDNWFKNAGAQGARVGELWKAQQKLFPNMENHGFSLAEESAGKSADQRRSEVDQTAGHTALAH